MRTAAIALLLSATAVAAPKFTSTWKAPEAAGVSFAGKKVAALVISDDQSLQMSGEEALVRELAAIGVPNGVATYRMMPREEQRDPAKARGWFERAAVDGVVAMRLVKAETYKTFTPTMWTTTSYSTLWGYYGYGWGTTYVSASGSTRTEWVAVIETLVFSVPLNKLLWAGVTETTNPKEAQQTVKEIVGATVKEMTKQGLLGAQRDRR